MIINGEGMERLDPRAIEFLERWPLADSAIVQHRFTPYMRDHATPTPLSADDLLGCSFEKVEEG